MLFNLVNATRASRVSSSTEEVAAATLGARDTAAGDRRRRRFAGAARAGIERGATSQYIEN